MDQGNTTFILIAAALVLLMTPGLAFFYGGLVKAKSVISMMMLSFGAIGLIGVLWVLYGYAITFANNVGIDGLIGIDTGAIGLTSLLEVPEGAAFPPLAALADAISSLVADSELRTRMGRAARERAVRLFDQQRCIDITLGAYERLLRGRGLSPPQVVGT